MKKAKNKKQQNFARFYVLLKQMPGQTGDLKESLVSSFTGQRTTSLHEMTQAEYKVMCDSMAAEINKNKPGQGNPVLKYWRSSVLTRLQKLGIDTSNWDDVDRFFMQPRIAGKLFRELTQEELQGLVPKLEAIARKSPRNTKQYRPNYIVIDDLEEPDEPLIRSTTPEIIPDWQLRHMLLNIDKTTLN